jgi:Arc/MetJ-type ribon-helix-helix transcriptional regulator
MVITCNYMTRKPKVYVGALPLSAVPELQEWLQPFIGGKGPRGNVVMVRLANEAVERLDVLVEAGLFGSRSEAAAFLVGAGIKSQQELFEKITRKSTEIQKLRRELRETALESLRTNAKASTGARRKKD